MTNDEFKAWRERHFPSRHAAALALGLNRDTLDALETGQTRNGTPFPVRPYMALACLAVDHGLTLEDDSFSRKERLKAALQEAAEVIDQLDN